MTLGSLFDGIGGFPLSASKVGIKAVWASEIEPWPIKVTEKHFPGMAHLGDLTKINGAEIPPVDVITFGSPCQDLSVAGKRAGLEGQRSGLFMEAVRIIREMREATYGIYPRYAVWENVPGAFSSNKGQDFRAVLEEIGDAEIPMPKSGRWATAGMVRSETADIAWRTIDAQYWGVPQRRRRIYLVADFGGTSASEILFVEQGLRGHSAESGETGQETTRTVREGVAIAVFAIDHVITTGGNCTAQGPCVKENGPMFTLKAAGSHAVAVRMREGCDGGGKEPLISEGRSLTLGCSNDQTLFTRIDSTPAGAIQSQPGMKQQTFIAGIDCRNGVENGDLCGTLQAKANGGFSYNCTHPVRIGYAVRRLTPLECLRLQGYPDWWLDIEGMSDTAKYKAIGNSLAIPCSDFVMAGIKREMGAT